MVHIAANNGVALQVCFANLATLHAYLHEKEQALECAIRKYGDRKKEVSPRLVPCRKTLRVDFMHDRYIAKALEVEPGNPTYLALRTET